MNMNKIIKRIIGALILSQIIPIIFMCASYSIDEPIMIAYISGLELELLFVIVLIMIILSIYLFQ